MLRSTGSVVMRIVTSRPRIPRMRQQPLGFLPLRHMYYKVLANQLLCRGASNNYGAVVEAGPAAPSRSVRGLTIHSGPDSRTNAVFVLICLWSGGRRGSAVYVRTYMSGRRSFQQRSSHHSLLYYYYYSESQYGTVMI